MDTKQFDLDALKRQLSKGEGDGWLSMHARHIPALLAEVERLQGEVYDLRDITLQQAQHKVDMLEAQAQRDKLRGALETIVAEYKDRYQLLDPRFAFHSGKGDLTMEQRSTHSSKVAAAGSIYKGVVKDISAALADTEPGGGE